MEHRVFWKKTCLVWVYFHVHLIYAIGLFSVIHRNLTCNRPRFEYLTKTIFYHFNINCFDKLSSKTAHVVEYNYIPLVRIFTACDCATGDSTVDIMAFLQTQFRGQNGTWYVGAKWHSGAKWNGESDTTPFYPQRSFILPQCSGPFYPTPIPHTKISVTKAIKRF